MFISDYSVHYTSGTSLDYGQYVAYTPRGLRPSVYKTTYRPPVCLKLRKCACIWYSRPEEVGRASFRVTKSPDTILGETRDSISLVRLSHAGLRLASHSFFSDWTGVGEKGLVTLGQRKNARVKRSLIKTSRGLIIYMGN